MFFPTNSLTSEMMILIVMLADTLECWKFLNVSSSLGNGGREFGGGGKFKLHTNLFHPWKIDDSIVIQNFSVLLYILGCKKTQYWPVVVSLNDDFGIYFPTYAMINKSSKFWTCLRFSVCINTRNKMRMDKNW